MSTVMRWKSRRPGAKHRIIEIGAGVVTECGGEDE
jgi:hypothetical protein